MHETHHTIMQQTNPPHRPQDSESATPSAFRQASESGQLPGQQKTIRTQRHSTAIGSGAGFDQTPDLVDRIFDYIFSEPSMARALEVMAKSSKQAHGGEDPVNQLKAAVRDEFSGERCYIAANPVTNRQQKVAEVLSLFNGRNATEVARRLQISRSTVYRYIKQPKKKA